MNWANLKSNLCPACGSELLPPDAASICRCPECEFGIREERLMEILDDMELDDAYRPYGPHDRV